MKFQYKYLIIANLFLVIFSYYSKNELSDFNEINSKLKTSPKQINLKKVKPFEFSYKGSDYTAYPKAKYEIYGLVVSHNDIESFWDRFHDEKSVDTKDLCIIWGENIKTNDFQKVSYSSGSWTCYFKYGAGVNFKHNQLSNNHLITNKQNVRDIIKTVSIGDQIHIKGYLVDYTNSKNNFKRKTSMTRDDTGATACEVVFVNKIKVISAPNKVWRKTYKVSFYSLIFLILFPLLKLIATEHFKK